jgi:cysteine synthase A
MTGPLVPRAPGVLAAIGRTPLLPLRRLVSPGSAEVWAKAEHLNPSGSVKDRLAAAAIADAEAAGGLRPGGTIVEATSGNTGVSLAMAGAALGYHVVIVMPADGPEETKKRLLAHGAEIVSSPPAQGMSGAAALAQRLATERRGFLVDQFANAAAVRAHEEGTGPEVLASLGERRVDAVVAGVGTGATLTGLALAVRKQHPAAAVVAVEPASSPILSKGRAALHRIPGIGPSFVPANLRRDLVTRVMGVSDEDAQATAADLARREGLFCGPSSGANVAAALRIAAELGSGALVVTVLPDSGDRYLRA